MHHQAPGGGAYTNSASWLWESWPGPGTKYYSDEVVQWVIAASLMQICALADTGSYVAVEMYEDAQIEGVDISAQKRC